MTTIQDRIIEIIKKHNNDVMSFPTPRELLNANKRLEQFLLTSIKEVEEETRKEDVKVINEIIQISNENSSTDWFDGLRCARESILSITNKEIKK